MLNDAGSPASPGVTRSNSDDKQQGGSDYSSRVSPSNGEFRQGYQNGNPQDPSKGYDAGRFNDRVGGGVSRPAPRDRYNGAPGYRTGPPRHHAEDGRAPYAPRGRYMSRTPGYRPHYNKGYVPRPPRGAFGDHRGGYQSGYRSRLPYHRGAYMDRESNGAGGYYREYSGHMDSRNHSPGPDRYNNDGGDGYYQTEPTHEQLSANSYEHGGSWEEDRKGAGNWDEGEVRSRHVRSRSMDSNHNNHSLRRSPSPVSRAVDEVIEAQERKQQSGEAGDQDGPGAFNEDSLFTAP
ncbi:hypothetical protein GGF46_004828 [Coemansia sp. RSA 552]|nr:hypothetical protein GGF46_004828 [Coemansia sp. RSA 552]